MSGGVDSSVAAALMLEAGHEVIGVTLKQWAEPDGSLPRAGCCTVADAEDARRVAAQLDIRYYVLDYVAAFAEAVVAPFADAYVNGRTPNPCVECNRRVRFDALLDRVGDLGCDFLVTGHHARVVAGNGRYRLLQGTDRSKDQSYVLHMLGQDQLARVRLPIGELTKTRVRAEARRLGLRTASKPDSQDICFVGDGDYRRLVARLRPESARRGNVVDTDGRVLGEHDGVAGFTIGQRRGLSIAGTELRYVVAVDAATATVVVGPRSRLEAAGCEVTDVVFVAGAPPESPQIDVKIRYRSDPAAATLRRADDRWEVRFETPQLAVAPGQAAVFYRGEEVLGGGEITTALAA